MIAEVSLGGVFLSSALISAVAALIAAWGLRKIFSWAGLYRWIWHPALFDTAVFVILWAAILMLPPFHGVR